MTRPLAALTVALIATTAVAGPGKKEAERAISDLRSAKDAKTKAAALVEIGKIGQVQKALVASATDDVLKGLKDKEPAVRAAAAECYGMLDPEPKEAVPALLKMLADEEDVRVKAGAVKGLGAIGPGAKEALPELRKVLQEGNKKQQEAVKKQREGKTMTPAERDAMRLDRELFGAARAAVQSIQPRKN